MTDPKTEKRLHRFLRLLAKTPAKLRDTGTPATKLLEFPGERSIRCSAADLDAMRRSGRVLLRGDGDGTELSITEAGRAALDRFTSGDFAGQHRHLRTTDIEIDGRRETVSLNDAESPLSKLARVRGSDRKPWLSRAELAAGERLRCDFEKALLQPRVTASWDLSRVAKSAGAGGNGSADLADHVLAARDRINAAIDAVGPDLGGALVDICCFLKGLEQVEREKAWPRRSAKLMLKTALSMLDRHYHPQSAEGRPARRILHWGAGDFRPVL